MIKVSYYSISIMYSFSLRILNKNSCANTAGVFEAANFKTFLQFRISIRQFLIADNFKLSVF